MKQAYSRSGIPLQAVYAPADLRGFDYERRLGTPGAYPYTRGRRADAVGGWIQRELSGEGEPSRSNEQLKYLLSQGQIGLDVIGDSPTMAFLRTQQIVHLESSVAKVVDPLGGSYFVESLTDEMEKRIWARVLEIEAMGDPADLSDKGWFKRFFEDAMADYSKRIAEGSLPKVGLNIFQIPEEEDTLLKEIVEGKIEPCWSRIERIKEYKMGRDLGKIRQVLTGVYEKAKGEENLMVPILEAFRSGATMGEIGGMMRMAYGYPYDPHGLIESPI
jgi:methylmalonyl-CoA mutase N-terminal domain/subunit